MEVAKELNRIYHEIQNYAPPEISQEMFTEKSLMSKLLPFGLGEQAKPKLDKKARLQGLYIWGSVGGGKTLLMDMFFDCCEKVMTLKMYF
jgi:protein AFG1